MKTGRPRQFDRDEAFVQAIHFFREQGNEAAHLPG